jgi:uncharacterized repeat protein (TIGR01451 family)
VPNVQVHWILARTGDAVGDIVAYDDMDLGGGAKPLTRKTDNHYAVSYTNEKPQVLDRGNRWVADEAAWTDFEVGLGQTWCTITSVVEGTSHMIAYVPAIEDGLRHKVFAVKYWQKVPHLVLTKECPDVVIKGTEFTYTITVKNDGEGPSSGNVSLMDLLPPGISIVDGTTFPMDLGPMAPGDVKKVSFRVRADTEGEKVNSAMAQAGEFSAADECVTRVLDYGIDLIKDCGGMYNLGDEAVFTLRVTNTRSATLSAVTVSDPLPAGVEFVNANATAGRAYIGGDGRTVTWDGFDLAPGGAAEATVTVRTTRLGVIRNAASVVATVQGIDARVEDSDTCEIEVSTKPELAIVKECSPSEVQEGDDVRVSITVTNIGQVAAKNVVVTDRLPDGLVVPAGGIQATVPGNVSGGVITWDLGTMEVGQSKTIAFQLEGGSFLGMHTNVATVRAIDFPNSPDDKDTDSCEVYVRGEAALQYWVVDADNNMNEDADLFKIGEQYWYVAHVENEGDLALRIFLAVATLDPMIQLDTTRQARLYVNGADRGAINLTPASAGAVAYTLDMYKLAPRDKSVVVIPVKAVSGPGRLSFQMLFDSMDDERPTTEPMDWKPFSESTNIRR